MDQYSIILTPEIEGGYMVSVPALPGCITQGETLTEALAMADEAIGLYLEEATEGKRISTVLIMPFHSGSEQLKHPSTT